MIYTLLYTVEPYSRDAEHFLFYESHHANSGWRPCQTCDMRTEREYLGDFPTKEMLSFNVP